LRFGVPPAVIHSRLSYPQIVLDGEVARRYSCTVASMNELPGGSHGAYRVAELRRHLGKRQIDKLVEEGRLVSYSKHVLVARERQLDVRTRAAATLLLAGPRSVLTRHTAAFLHGCAAADVGQIHVMVDYHRRLSSMPGVAVHRGLFDEGDVVLLDGLRVMPLAHTLAELLCRASRREAMACLDQALALTPDDRREDLRADVLHQIGTRRDPRGRRRSQILLDLANGQAESPAESWLLLDLFDAGFPVPAQQLPVLDMNGRTVFRLDYAWEEPRVALEYDGYTAHADRIACDRARDEDLRRRGWIVVHATADDLKDPSRLHPENRRAFWQRRFAA
jgi:hypothetical protein